ncbi:MULTISPECIES: NAD-dependent epimerase/dehydratase family protein [Mesorhizobium]|uniref:NAD-dependent epimerase/dehydratase family protein n=1 Tax=Mesorhizobium TaxID=68287 RepID=UPI001FE84A65|nr:MULTISPECIES: NAD-dependent epimerase/dehydratase family protein [Mesorhizobium]
MNGRVKILIVGHGVLGGAVLDFLSQSGRPYDLHVGARDLQRASLRVNLAKYTAVNLGLSPAIEVVPLDLMNTEATAERLAALRPDIIFNATTLHSWWRITQLPTDAYQQIDRARGGVWTPMHLVLVRRLMRAVREAGVESIVVNASYPDVTNAALAAEGLSPTIGIGNIANAVPGIRLAAAHLLGCELKAVDVQFFAQHYVSYRMPSTGSTDGAPYHLTIYRSGQEVKPQDLGHDEIFANVAGRFRRVKGLAGQSVTASSATATLRAFADHLDRVVHAPGPLGLVGGYPVRIAPTGISIELPQGLSLDDAVEINSQCQTYDGIEAVESDGTVRFTGESAGILRDLLGYDCEAMALDECEKRAEELAAKYAEYCCRLQSGATHARLIS